jgi:outer membrane immunogenic protein
MRHHLAAGLLLTVTAVAAASVAQGADLAAPVLTTTAPRGAAYDWSGFYAGVNVGYGVANDPSVFAETDFPLSETFKVAPSGINGGAQAGYNFQTGRWLAGLEADFQGANQSDTACVAACSTGPFSIGGTVSQKLSWFSTVRGRVGVTADRVLFYLTGGLAYGRVQTSATGFETFAAPGGTTSASVTATKSGSVFGGGIEAALGGPWTARIEYLHIDLGSQSLAFQDPFIPRTDMVTASMRENVFRAGVNYRFGAAPAGAAAPVMPVKAPYATAPIFAWTGWYGGVNAGYGVANDRSTYVVSDPPPIGLFNAESYKLAPAGAVGGVQVGYNFKMADWVAGVETDIQATGQKDTACVFGCSTNIALAGDTGVVQQKLDWFGTARARLGVVAGQTLFYATGGLAYGNVKMNVTQDAGLPIAATASINQTRLGAALGGGLEAALGGNWTGKVEYLYLDLGSQSVTFLDPPGVRTATVAATMRDNVVRAGLNYHLTP